MEDNTKSDLLMLENGELAVHNKTHILGVKILNIHNSVAPLRWLSENSYAYSLVLNAVMENG
jgi:hypothetical protein